MLCFPLFDRLELFLLWVLLMVVCLPCLRSIRSSEEFLLFTVTLRKAIPGHP